MSLQAPEDLAGYLKVLRSYNGKNWIQPPYTLALPKQWNKLIDDYKSILNRAKSKRKQAAPDDEVHALSNKVHQILLEFMIRRTTETKVYKCINVLDTILRSSTDCKTSGLTSQLLNYHPVRYTHLFVCGLDSSA